MNKIENYDKNMVAKCVLEDESFKYFDVKDAPFRIEGLAWFDKEKKFYRLPYNAKDKVSEAVAWLASHPSGAQVYFHTNSKIINIKVILNDVANMIHMAATGQTGFDLYFKTPNMSEYQFFTTSTYPYGQKEYNVTIFKSDVKFEKDILINFPLYMGVKEVQIGIEKDALLSEANNHKNFGKIVVYGTSITQGGCVSRPGMSYTNLLSRKLDYEFINLGFSGNGLGEPIMAKFINDINDVKMIVLDYDANGGVTGHLEKYLNEFLDILRSHFKTTPILIITKPPFSNYVFLEQEIETRKRVFDFQKNTVKNRRKKDKNLYFYDGNKLFGTEDYYESLVDGIHPNDLGFYRIFKHLYPVFKKILKK